MMIFASNKNIKRIIEFVASASVVYDCATEEQKRQLLGTLSNDEVFMLNDFQLSKERMQRRLQKKQ